MPYVSTIKQRTQEKITQRDLAALSGFCFGPDGHPGRNICTEDIMHSWNKNVPLFPQDVETIFEKLSSKTKPFHVRFNEDFCLFSFVSKYDQNNQIVIGIKSPFFIEEEGEEVLFSISLKENMQGRGIGRSSLQAGVEFAAALGFKELNLHASWENGGYTWAKAGVLLSINSELGADTPVSGGNTRYILNHIRNSLEILEGLVSPKAADDIHETVDTIKPHSLVQIAHRPERLTLEELKMRELTRPMSMVFESWKSRGMQDVPIGALLLSGTDWPGRISFSNNRQMTKIGAYCGGWKTLQPV